MGFFLPLAFGIFICIIAYGFIWLKFYLVHRNAPRDEILLKERFIIEDNKPVVIITLIIILAIFLDYFLFNLIPWNEWMTP